MFRRLSSMVSSNQRGSTSSASTQPVEEAEKFTQSTVPDVQQVITGSDIEGQVSRNAEEDVFGNEEGAEIQYKTCEWW